MKVAGALVIVAMACAGCAGNAAHEPTLPTVDFRPKIMLEVDEVGMRFGPGPRADSSSSFDPATVASGSVMVITNTGRADHRVQGGTTFDTGVMKPRESTTVVLTNAESTDKVVVVRDTLPPESSSSITVRPKVAL